MSALPASSSSSSITDGNQTTLLVTMPPVPPEAIKRTYVSEKSGRSKRVVRAEHSRRARNDAVGGN